MDVLQKIYKQIYCILRRFIRYLFIYLFNDLYESLFVLPISKQVFICFLELNELEKLIKQWDIAPNNLSNLSFLLLPPSNFQKQNENTD